MIQCSTNHFTMDHPRTLVSSGPVSPSLQALRYDAVGTRQTPLGRTSRADLLTWNQILIFCSPGVVVYQPKSRRRIVRPLGRLSQVGIPF